MSVPEQETPDLLGAFPRLSEAQMDALAAHGRQRPIRPGEVLYREGDRDGDFIVVRRGAVAIVDHARMARGLVRVAAHRPDRRGRREGAVDRGLPAQLRRAHARGRRGGAGRALLGPGPLRRAAPPALPAMVVARGPRHRRLGPHLRPDTGVGAGVGLQDAHALAEALSRHGDADSACWSYLTWREPAVRPLEAMDPGWQRMGEIRGPADRPAAEAWPPPG